MTPTIGRIVIYKTNQQDREIMAAQRGNLAKELPAVIVNVWNDDCVNLKVIMDGPGELWRTSIVEGEGEGHWSWPVINK